MRNRDPHLTRFFASATSAQPASAWRPAADVYRTEYGWLLKFDLAGVCLEDVSVEARGSSITISGQRRDSIVEQGCSYYSMEISYHRFERTIQLPCDIEGARLALDCRNGILFVRVFTNEECP